MLDIITMIGHFHRRLTFLVEKMSSVYIIQLDHGQSMRHRISGLPVSATASDDFSAWFLELLHLLRATISGQ